MIVISVGVLAFGGAVVNAIANAIANASANVIEPVGFYQKKLILKISFLKRTVCGNQLQAYQVHVESARSRQGTHAM